MVTSTFNVNVSTAISAYLYGTPTPPEDVSDRLRDASDTIERSFDVDVSNYMQSVGRFTSPFQTDVVKSFFPESLDLSGFTSANDGSYSFTLSDLAAINPAYNNTVFSISQYTTGVTEGDFVERAFIWGTTAFQLNQNTHFSIDTNGVRSIDNAAIIPYGNENFDFVSPNLAVQYVNENVLRPLVDPYQIGRKVNFVFTNAESWIANSAGHVFHADDVPPNMVSPTTALEIGTIEVGYLLAATSLYT